MLLVVWLKLDMTKYKKCTFELEFAVFFSNFSSQRVK